MRSVFAPHTVAKPATIKPTDPVISADEPRSRGTVDNPVISENEQSAAAPIKEPVIVPPAPQQLDPRDLAKSIVQAQMEAQQQQMARTSAQKDMTPQEFNEKYGVVQVTPQHINEIFNAKDPAQAAAVLNNLLQSAVRQGVLMSQGLYKNDIGQFQQKFNSFEQYQQKQIHENLWSEFAVKNPDLANERAAVEEAVAAAIGRGENFKDKSDAFDQLSGRVRSLIQRLRGGGTGAPNGAPTTDNRTQQQGVKPRPMAPTLTGGRSGSGPIQPANDIQSIFGGTSNPAFRKR